MPETKTERNPDSNDPAETEFRKKHLWHSFTGSLYRGIGGAAFFGLLVTVVRAIIDIAAGGNAAVQAASMFGVSPMLVMGACVALGTACMYMAERESTKLKILEDKYQVGLAAKQREKQRALEQMPTLQEQPHRADGKSWEQVTQALEQVEQVRG